MSGYLATHHCQTCLLSACPCPLCHHVQARRCPRACSYRCSTSDFTHVINSGVACVRLRPLPPKRTTACSRAWAGIGSGDQCSSGLQPAQEVLQRVPCLGSPNWKLPSGNPQVGLPKSGLYGVVLGQALVRMSTCPSCLFPPMPMCMVLGLWGQGKQAHTRSDALALVCLAASCNLMPLLLHLLPSASSTDD